MPFASFDGAVEAMAQIERIKRRRGYADYRT